MNNPVYEFTYKINNQEYNMIVTSVAGHLMELKIPEEFEKNWYSTNPIQLFDVPVTKKVKKDYVNIERTLKREVRNSDWLVLWLDCDREGENIAFEVIEVCKKVRSKLQILRARFSTLLPNEIHYAINHLTTPNKLDSLAVDARIELDLRIGFSFTRFQTLRFRSKFGEITGKQPISFGPCQFPTLGFVVDRYWKNKYFKKEEFWTIDVNIEKDRKIAHFNWDRIRLFDRLACIVLYELLIDFSEAQVIKVESKPTRKYRPLPLTTVEFQKLATKNLKLTSEQAMNIAEKLYQKGLISYPRTETDSFAKDFDFKYLIQNQVEDPNWGQYSLALLNDKFRTPREGKNNDQSHPPIYPTKYTNTFDKPEERKVYELITRHFLACCSEDALGDKTNVSIKIHKEIFHCKGLTITAKNFLDIYPYVTWSNNDIPSFKVGEKLKPKDILMRQGFTTPPPLLTEAELIQLMNDNGIGTDSTISSIIETIITRKYAVRQGARREFKPTELGESLVAGYNFIGYRKLNQPQIRARMEKDMNDISKGIKTKETVVKDNIKIYKEIFIDIQTKAKDLDKAIGRYFKVIERND